MVCNKLSMCSERFYYKNKRKIVDISGNVKYTTNDDEIKRQCATYDSDSSSSQLSSTITPIREKLNKLSLDDFKLKYYDPYHQCDHTNRKCCIENFQLQERLLDLTLYKQYKCTKKTLKYKYLMFTYKYYHWSNEYLFDDLPYPFTLNPFSCGVCPICIYKNSKKDALLNDDYECLFPHQEANIYEKWYYQERDRLIKMGSLDHFGELQREQKYKEKYLQYKRKF